MSSTKKMLALNHNIHNNWRQCWLCQMSWSIRVCPWGFHEALTSSALSWNLHKHAHGALMLTCAWGLNAHIHSRKIRHQELPQLLVFPMMKHTQDMKLFSNLMNSVRWLKMQRLRWGIYVKLIPISGWNILLRLKKCTNMTVWHVFNDFSAPKTWINLSFAALDPFIKQSYRKWH